MTESSTTLAATTEPPVSAPAEPGTGGKVARNAFHLVLGQATTTVLAVLLSAALGRWLGAKDFGLFFLVQSMASFGFVIVDWGQAQFAIREVARHPEQAGRLLGGVLALRGAGGLGMTVLTALAAWLLGYDSRTIGFAALMVVAMLPFNLAQGFGIIFRGRERMGRDATVSMLNKALTLGAALLLLALGAGLPGAIVAQAAGGVVAVTAAAFLMREIGIPSIQATRHDAVRLIRGGTPILMLGLAVAAQSYLDAIVLSKLAPQHSVGWFGAARNVFSTLIAPANILAAATYPALSRASHDPVLLSREMKVSMRPLTALAALGGVGTYLFADGAVALIYGDGFVPTGAILRVYACGMFLLFLDLMLSTAVLAVARTRPLALAKWLSVTATTVLAVFLVPIFEARYDNGGIGIALAFVTSEVIMFFTALRILPKGTLSRSTLADIGRALCAGAGTLVLFHLLPPLPLWLGAPACVLVFALLALLVRLVRPAEALLLVSVLRRRLRQGGAAT